MTFLPMLIEPLCISLRSAGDAIQMALGQRRYPAGLQVDSFCILTYKELSTLGTLNSYNFTPHAPLTLNLLVS